MPRRPFTAELQTAGRNADTRPSVADGSDLTEVLARLARLEAAVERLAATSVTASAPVSTPDAPAPDQPCAVPEDPGRVARTQAEIAALRDTSAGDDPLTAASRELREVVDATETATEQILGSAETVEQAVSNMLALAVDPVMRVHLDDALEAVMRIFEAANFQDITGQRVSKVVRALNVVETRLVAIEDLWRPDMAPVIAVPIPEVTDDDRHLLNGPQLDDGGMSQDDIDAMFD